MVQIKENLIVCAVLVAVVFLSQSSADDYASQDNAMPCLNLTREGAGQQQCLSGVILWYVVAVPVIVVVLLMFSCFVCFVYRRIWNKRPRPASPADDNEATSVNRRIRISLAHIYEDIGNRLGHVHMPFTRAGSGGDEEDKYESRLTRGKQNDAFQPENVNNSRYVTKFSIDEGTDKTDDTIPVLDLKKLFSKRPSQPNEYILEDADELPGPEYLKKRAQSVDIPLRNAPDIPPDTDEDADPTSQTTPDPSPEVSADPSPDLNVDPSHDQEFEQHSTSLPSSVSSITVNDPDPDPDSEPFLDQLIEQPQVCPPIPKPKPKPPCQSNSDPDQTIDDPVPVVPQREKHTNPSMEQANQEIEDDVVKPKPPLKPSANSEQDKEYRGETQTSARPQLPAKPGRVVQSDTAKIEPGKQSQRPKPPSISIYKKTEIVTDNISHSGSVDLKIMEDAIRRVRVSTGKPPVKSGLVTRPNSSQADSIDDPIEASPTDTEFMKTVMEVYLELMHEVYKQEDDYEVAINREKEKVDSDKPATDHRALLRRKSYSAQLLLKQKRKNVQSGEIYVNQWNKSWEFKRENLVVDRTQILGEGAFGKVFKARATGLKNRPGQTLVAVKELKDGADQDDKDEFLKELAIHTIMKPHPHVVELLGCCIRDEPICIITEYLSGGSLLGFLRKAPAKQDVAQHYIAKFGLHIARGMAYVAEMEIVHRDLAARNILISEDEVCKVADFGFARDIFGIECYPRAPEIAPIRWYAPEAILDNLFSTKSDVWSFGILLFEIATLGRVPPYKGRKNEEVRIQVSTGTHPSKPPYCDNNLFDILKKCWSRKADDRPSFRKLVDMFEDIQSQYPDPSQDNQRVSLNTENEESSF